MTTLQDTMHIDEFDLETDFIINTDLEVEYIYDGDDLEFD